MSNPSGSDGDAQPTTDDGTPPSEAGPEAPPTEVIPSAAHTESDTAPEPSDDAAATPERRFTAPSGFDAGSTQVIGTVAEPATEVFNVPGATSPTEPIAAAGPVAPQVIPGRGDSLVCASW